MSARAWPYPCNEPPTQALTAFRPAPAPVPSHAQAHGHMAGRSPPSTVQYQRCYCRYLLVRPNEIEVLWYNGSRLAILLNVIEVPD